MIFFLMSSNFRRYCTTWPLLFSSWEWHACACFNCCLVGGSGFIRPCQVCWNQSDMKFTLASFNCRKLAYAVSDTWCDRLWSGFEESEGMLIGISWYVPITDGNRWLPIYLTCSGCNPTIAERHRTQCTTNKYYTSWMIEIDLPIVPNKQLAL